jgi:hypothetical protein
VNMNGDPTKAELRQLLCECDDEANSHVVWVDDLGDVNISTLLQGVGPVDLERLHPDMKVRLETLHRGGGYVGPLAAADPDWVSQLFDGLVERWEEGKRVDGVLYSDKY